MRNKFILLEEDEFDPVEEIHTDLLNKTTLISSLIKGEWDAIDQYNGIIATLESISPDDKESIETLKEIVSEEYIHVGQLEKLVQGINPEADNIEAGHEHDEHSPEEVDPAEGV